ncbi:hypothetical protein GCM10023322_59160 [Rugosimonospora acidiphila]|uniref:Radical SAM core domain-containing protein n=1 Tax=Rugosimonospora acidiphila TaxID=556531 RepID=A0ABP9SFE2_9ACTN
MRIVDQLGKLDVPQDDIVVFRTATHRLAMNSSMASWALLSPRQDDLLSSLARGVAPSVSPDGPYRSARDLDRDLAHLVLNYMVYLPGWRPRYQNMKVDLNIVYYAITEGCNLRCPYCYASSEKKLPGELTPEETLRLVDQVADAGAETMVFTGGEPMMRRDLFDAVRRAKERGLRTNIITNGTLIRRIETARIMAELFDRVTISMDGGTAERHEPTRGRGTFAKSIKGLGLLNEVGVAPIINHVITAENVDYMEELASLGERFRIRHIRVQQHSDLGRAKYDDLSFEWAEYLKTDDFVWSSPYAKHLIDDSKAAVKPCNIRGNCGMGGHEIYVNSLGNVYPCKLVTSPADLAGNVRHASLAEIFEAPSMKELRDSNIFDGSVHTDCHRCYIRGACGGGCRAFHMARSGDLRKNSRHFCRILRHTQISTIWKSLGVDRSVVDDPGAFVPIRPADGSVHPVYEDWRNESPVIPKADLVRQRRLLPVVGVSA